MHIHVTMKHICKMSSFSLHQYIYDYTETILDKYNNSNVINLPTVLQINSCSSMESCKQTAGLVSQFYLCELLMCLFIEMFTVESEQSTTLARVLSIHCVEKIVCNLLCATLVYHTLFEGYRAPLVAPSYTQNRLSAIYNYIHYNVAFVMQYTLKYNDKINMHRA